MILTWERTGYMSAWHVKTSAENQIYKFTFFFTHSLVCFVSMNLYLSLDTTKNNATIFSSVKGEKKLVLDVFFHFFRLFNYMLTSRKFYNYCILYSMVSFVWVLTLLLPCTLLIPNVTFQLVFLFSAWYYLLKWGRVMQAQLYWEHHTVWQILLTWGNLTANYQKNWRIFSLWKPDEIPINQTITCLQKTT